MLGLLNLKGKSPAIDKFKIKIPNIKKNKK